MPATLLALYLAGVIMPGRAAPPPPAPPLRTMPATDARARFTSATVTTDRPRHSASTALATTSADTPKSPITRAPASTG